MKKIYIVLTLTLSLILMGCSTDSLMPSEKITENTEPTITQIEDQENIVPEKTNIEPEIKEDGSKSRTYENKTEKFSFDFADGREFEENKYGFNTIVFTPKDDKIKENVWIAVQHLQKFLSVQEYYEETENKLKSTLKDFKKIEAKDIAKGDLKWKTITYQHKEWDNSLKTQQTFLISNENIVYIINYTATNKTFDKFLEWTELIVNSFNIIN